MRLLHVVPTYLPAVRYGGPIRSVHGLCAALAARGHDVHVFTTNVDGPVNSEVPIATPVDRDGVKVWYFPSPWLRRLYWSPQMGKALARDVPAFDLVHLHSVFLWPTWAAARAARAARVPYLLSPRGMLVRELIRARSRAAKLAWIALAEKANLCNAAAIHATTPREAADLAEFGYPLKGRVFVVPNGVTVTDSPAAAVPASPPYLLALGRVSWKKRLGLAIEAMRLVEGARLVIAGGDEEGLTTMLEAQAAALGVADRVHFAGHVEGDVKAKLLNGALALVMPSMSENFGNSALEAMAVGTPPIVVQEVGLADAIEQSGAGLVVPATPEGIAEAARRLQHEPTLRASMSEQAKSLVRDQFTWSAVAARMESEYAAVLDSQHH